MNVLNAEQNTLLYLVRHGETDWNVANRFQGQADIPLNGRGHSQGAALARYFAGQPIQRVYSSDLQRAKDTASYISMAKGLTTEVLPELREISFGSWEGMTRSEIGKQYPAQVRLWREDPSKLAVPGAETYPVAQERLCQTIKRLVAANCGNNIVVVSHGGAIRLLLTGLLEMDLTGIWHFTLESAGINQLVFYPEGRVVLKRLNQIVWE